jgi:hypothetical protein
VTLIGMAGDYENGLMLAGEEHIEIEKRNKIP